MQSGSSSPAPRHDVNVDYTRPIRSTTVDEVEEDEGEEGNDDDLFEADDPLALAQDDTPLTSFQRLQKATNKISLPKILASPFVSLASPSSSDSTSQAQIRRRRTPTLNGTTSWQSQANGLRGTDVKDAGGVGGVDWYIEGPGRRVGYEDFTAIDWIFEYAKERQRLSVLLSNTSGLMGFIRRLLDGSQIWLILVFTGIATGLVAAFIDVASDWLGDLKTGACRNVEEGGQFYMNKAFCCWGHDEHTQCKDWKTWGQLSGRSNGAANFILGYIFFVLFAVPFATAASVLVRSYAPYAKHSGIPEIKTVLGGFVMRRFFGSWTLVIKSLGLCLAVASGLWLGKEGPLVHLACCCANLFLNLSPILNSNEARKREVFSAAAAAGISVAFGAPVGGVLFSLEQLSFYFPDKTMWQSFVCAMVAAMTLKAFNPFRTDKLVLYQVTYSTGWHSFEIAPFALLGIVGGLYGAMFIKLNMKIAQWRKSYSPIKSPVLEVAIVALGTALINFPNKFMRAQSTELVATLFSECSEMPDEQLGLCGLTPVPAVLSSLLAAAVLGFFLAAITFGLQIPAGIILPSMAIGSLVGRAVGLITRAWQLNHPNLIIFNACEPDVPCVTAGTYAIVGAAAALAGATRMTVSIVVIMFELTGALTYVLPIMISVMISKWVGDAFGRRGIYEAWININGYPFLDNRDDTPVPDVNVSTVMTRIEDLVIIQATGHTIGSLERLLKANQQRGFPVISDSRTAILLGYISRTELAFALESAASAPRSLPSSSEAYFIHQPYADTTQTLDLRPWMDQTPITLGSKSPFQLAADMFMRLGLRYIMFCDRGRLKGILTKKDIWVIMNDIGSAADGAGSGHAAAAGNHSERRRFGGAVAAAGVLREHDQGGNEVRGLLEPEGEGGDSGGGASEDEDHNPDYGVRGER